MPVMPTSPSWGRRIRCLRISPATQWGRGGEIKLTKPVKVSQAYNPALWSLGQKGPGVWGQCWLHRYFETNLDYIARLASVLAGSGVNPKNVLLSIKKQKQNPAGTVSPVCNPESHPWNPHGEKKEPTPGSCSLTSTCVPWCASPHTERHVSLVLKTNYRSILWLEI